MLEGELADFRMNNEVLSEELDLLRRSKDAIEESRKEAASICLSPPLPRPHNSSILPHKTPWSAQPAIISETKKADLGSLHLNNATTAGEGPQGGARA